MKQNLKKVKDNSIGIGLACSHAICREMGGDMILRESKQGLTAFAFKIPVKVNINNSKFSENQIEKNDDPIPAEVCRILKDRNLDESLLNKVCFKKIQLKEEAKINKASYETKRKLLKMKGKR